MIGESSSVSSSSEAKSERTEKTGTTNPTAPIKNTDESIMLNTGEVDKS